MRINNEHWTHVMRNPHHLQAPKKATNLSINSDLLRRAKALRINLSATLENALTDLLREQQQQQWRRENADAIGAYNAIVERHGTFSEELRSF